ncbi:MAG: hypothetical protein E2O47_04690 [Gemmatimonadetes bacterium]|nr:MAG: hypothetical protein E2O47_04690 [Gemmatimonadota bacterium]
MRQVFRFGAAMLLLGAIMLPRLAPAICHWTDRPCAPEQVMEHDAAWSDRGDTSRACPLSDCGFVQVTPILAPACCPVIPPSAYALPVTDSDDPPLAPHSLLTPPPQA